MQQHLQLQSRVIFFDRPFAITRFLWCTFQTHFGMGMRHLQKVVLRMKLYSPCNLSFVVQLIQQCENMLSHVLLSKSKISHLYRIRVALVSLVSDTRVVKQTRSFKFFIFSNSRCSLKRKLNYGGLKRKVLQERFA